MVYKRTDSLDYRILRYPGLLETELMFYAAEKKWITRRYWIFKLCIVIYVISIIGVTLLIFVSIKSNCAKTVKLKWYENMVVYQTEVNYMVATPPCNPNHKFCKGVGYGSLEALTSERPKNLLLKTNGSFDAIWPSFSTLPEYNDTDRQALLQELVKLKLRLRPAKKMTETEFKVIVELRPMIGLEQLQNKGFSYSRSDATCSLDKRLSGTMKISFYQNAERIITKFIDAGVDGIIISDGAWLHKLAQPHGNQTKQARCGEVRYMLKEWKESIKEKSADVAFLVSSAVLPDIHSWLLATSQHEDLFDGVIFQLPTVNLNRSNQVSIVCNNDTADLMDGSVKIIGPDNVQMVSQWLNHLQALVETQKNHSATSHAKPHSHSHHQMFNVRSSAMEPRAGRIWQYQKAINTLLLTMGGISVLLYGEEIGMENETRLGACQKQYSIYQWNRTDLMGFYTRAQTIAFRSKTGQFKTLTQAAINDITNRTCEPLTCRDMLTESTPSRIPSVLAYTRKLIQIRKQEVALRLGRIVWITGARTADQIRPLELFSFLRSAGRNTSPLFIAVNLSDRTQAVYFGPTLMKCKEGCRTRRKTSKSAGIFGKVIASTAAEGQLREGELIKTTNPTLKLGRGEAIVVRMPKFS